MKLKPTSGAEISTIAHKARLTSSSRSSLAKSNRVRRSSRDRMSDSRRNVRPAAGLSASSRGGDPGAATSPTVIRSHAGGDAHWRAWRCRSGPWLELGLSLGVAQEPRNRGAGQRYQAGQAPHDAITDHL